MRTELLIISKMFSLKCVEDYNYALDRLSKPPSSAVPFRHSSSLGRDCRRLALVNSRLASPLTSETLEYEKDRLPFIFRLHEKDG